MCVSLSVNPFLSLSIYVCVSVCIPVCVCVRECASLRLKGVTDRGEVERSLNDL